MRFNIMIDIFSGRKNPVIELSDSESTEVLSHLKPEKKLLEKHKALPPEPTLGYRGLIVEQIGEPDRLLPRVFRYVHGDLFGEGLAHKAADERFEEFLSGRADWIQKLDLLKDFPKVLKDEVDKFRELRLRLEPKYMKMRELRLLPWWPCRFWWPCYWWCWRRCRCAPIYEPDWWNDGGQIQYSNNCYNYSTNYRTDPRAQPGRASNSEYNDLSSCDPPAPAISAKAGAVSDGLIDWPEADNNCPSNGHLVALVVWPWYDYHWYRKGRNGYWSHKPGSSPVTNLDNDGNSISDPRTANRGGYTDFCTFMIVRHGHIKIK